MIRLSNNDLFLDDNGVDIVDGAGKSLADLHNDYVVESLIHRDDTLEIKLSKEVGSTQRPGALEMVLLIDGVREFEPNNLRFPCDFEGIYDYSAAGLSLCLGEACWPVRGEGLTVRLMNHLK